MNVLDSIPSISSARVKQLMLTGIVDSIMPLLSKKEQEALRYHAGDLKEFCCEKCARRSLLAIALSDSPIETRETLIFYRRHFGSEFHRDVIQEIWTPLGKEVYKLMKERKQK